MLVVPAVSDGLNGNGSMHGLPFGPERIWNSETGSAGALPDHGSIEAPVVYPPHNAGLPNGALDPPKKCSFKSSNGSCGVFLNEETNCPVTGSGLTSPATLTSTPAVGSSATRYNATRLPKGLAFCAARYISPVNGSGNSGELISAVATFDASGQDTGPSVLSATCASEQACRPSPAAGFNATPAGNVTVVSFTSASASPAAFKLKSCGTCTPTVKPVGVLPACPSGATLTVGPNGKRLQPSSVGIGSVEENLWKLPASTHESASTEVCNELPLQAVGNVKNGGGCNASNASQG